MPDPNPTAPADRPNTRPADPDATAPGTARTTSGEFNLGAPVAPGEVGALGPYRLVKELGRGGMGAVYLALDTRLDRELALKVMLPAFAADPAARERFVREAKAVANIAHDNVVTIYEADERDGVPYIAMQLLQGYPLDEFLKKKGAPPLEHCARIGIEAARGLAAAHALGLVHRDIKPANLWLEAPNGRVKVLDFGLAKPVGTDTELTKSGAVVGTPAFMSPEQARGLKVDHRTDIFSLGTVLYRLLTGTNPFAGENVMAVLMALGTEEPKPIGELNPTVPAALAAVVMRMLAKKPEARPQTASEVAQGLRAALAQPSAPTAEVSTSAPVVVYPLPLPVPQPMYVTVAPESAFANLTDDDGATEHEALAAREPEPVAPKRGNKALALGLGAVALVAVVAVAVALGTGGKKPDDTARSGDPPPVVPTKDSGKEPPPPAPAWKPVPVGESPFDKLSASAIPKDERFVWQPPELVAVVGTHKGRMWSGGWAAFSPDNKYAVAGYGGLVWDVATGTPKWPLTSARYQSYTPAGFSADGTRAYVSQHAGLVAFDLTDGGPKPVKVSNDGIPLPIVSREPHRNWSVAEGGKTLLYGAHWGGATVVELYDASGAEPRKSAELPVLMPAFAPGANRLVYATADGKLRRATVRAAKFADDAELAIPFGPKSTHLSVAPDGTRLCFRANGEPLHVWDIAANPPAKLHEFPFEQLNVYNTYALAPGGRWLADMYSAVRVRRIDGPTAGDWVVLEPNGVGGASTVAFSADGTRAATVSDVGFVRFWDLSGDAAKELTALDATQSFRPPYPRSGDRFLDSPSGRLTLKRYDWRAQVWALTGARPVPFPNADAVLESRTARPLARDRWATGGSEGSRCDVYALGTKGFEFVTEAAPATDEAHVSPDGTRLYRIASANTANRIECADLSGAAPKTKWVLESKERPVVPNENARYFALSGDNRWMAHVTGPRDGPHELALWRVSGAKPEFYAALPVNAGAHYFRAALSPDGRLLAHANGAVIVEDLTGRAPREVVRFTGGTRPNGWNLEGGWMSFHPDGTTLVLGSGWVGVRVVDARAGTVLWQWDPPAGAGVHWAEFAHDGRHLFVHLSNNTIYVLRLDLTGARDRAAAEWALSVNGAAVSIWGHNPAIQRAADLPAEFKLHGVYLTHKPVTDADVARLATCAELHVLALPGTAVTDASLEHIVSLSKLHLLDVSRTKVTAAGVQKLAKALPHCKIVWDGGAIEPKAQSAPPPNPK